nr:S-layer homology domain-containing protein [Acidimicrobiia bacterium]
GVHQPAIDALRESIDGIFAGTGCNDGVGFCHGEPLLRWEMAVWLVRVLDGVDPPEPAVSRFSDVDDAEWWMAYVERLAELEVTRGCAADPPSFCPNNPVSRAQMASFLVRAFEISEAQAAGFDDVRGGAHAGDIDALAAAGITVGCGVDPWRYCPQDDVQRGQMASFLARTLGLVPIPSVKRSFASIESSWLHSCGLRTDGRVECWGFNGDGRADAPGGVFSQVSAGGYHSCGLRTDGGVECWGLNGDGQVDAPGGVFSQVSAGGNHSCGLRIDGGVECWGRNADGQADAPGGVFSQVSAGAIHTCGLRTDGRVECWGLDLDGQTSAPRSAFRSVSAGGRHSCGVRTDGLVECWGPNEAGQIDVPRAAFVAVSVGAFHSCGLKTDGRIECWGLNSGGSTNTPASTFSSVTAGGLHSCGILTDGHAECWGRNDANQLEIPGS